MSMALSLPKQSESVALKLCHVLTFSFVHSAQTNLPESFNFHANTMVSSGALIF